MDITDGYIEMCQNAVDIQEIWQPDIGDNHVWNATYDIIGTSNFKSHTCLEARDKKIWGGEEHKKYIVGEYKEWVLMSFDMTRIDVLRETVSTLIEDFQYTYKHYDGCIWLPRQDQLQDMLKDQIKKLHKDSFGYIQGRYPEGYICLCLMSDFETFIDSEYQYIDYVGFDSMEQLWLIFVMDTKYKKRWDGIRWIPNDA